MNADVIIVGACPTGLMLAAELRLAGVRALVLERRQQLREIPRANGFGGQIAELLRYRGLLDRVVAAGTGAGPAGSPAAVRRGAPGLLASVGSADVGAGSSAAAAGARAG